MDILFVQLWVLLRDNKPYAKLHDDICKRLSIPSFESILRVSLTKSADDFAYGVAVRMYIRGMKSSALAVLERIDFGVDLRIRLLRRTLQDEHAVPCTINDVDPDLFYGSKRIRTFDNNTIVVYLNKKTKLPKKRLLFRNGNIILLMYLHS